MRLNMLKKGRFTIMPTGGSDFLSTIGQFFQGPGLMIVMMVVLLLVMIIPQRKRDKKIKDMLSSIKVCLLYTSPSPRDA